MSVYMKNRRIKQGHRTLIIIVAVVVGLFFALSSINELAFTFGGERYREAKLNTIVEALQTEDVDAIKRLFSKNTIEAVGEDKLEEDIRYLFTVFEGDVQTIEMFGGGFSASVRGFKRSKSSSVNADVTTDVDIYAIYCPDEIFNSFDRGDVGIERLAVQTLEDSEKYGSPSGNYKGVFRTDIVATAFDKAQPADSIETVLNALESGDADTLVGMFSQRALDEVGTDKIQAGAEYSCRVIEGEIISRDSSNADMDTNIIDGKVQVILEVFCNIQTYDENWYTVDYREILIDEMAPEKIGIDRMLVQKDDIDGGEWPLNWYADSMGIFCPENEDPRAFTNWEDLQE